MAERIFHLSVDPAGAAAARLAEAIAGREGRVRLAVAGGSAAPALGGARRLLGRDLWGRVRLTWVDERCLPFAHPESNRGSAHRGGHLDPAEPPALELPLYLDGETPAEACARVLDAFRKDFQGGLDLLLLGLGEDGHIASLFPGRLPAGTEAVLAVADSPKPPAARITFNLPVLTAAAGALLVAFGTSKREALRRLRSGDPALPASALPHLDVYTDPQTFEPGA